MTPHNTIKQTISGSDPVMTQAVARIVTEFASLSTMQKRLVRNVVDHWMIDGFVKRPQKTWLEMQAETKFDNLNF